MDRVKEAAANFQEGRSCSQAVFLAFSDLYGLDKETAVKLAASFGGGMGMGDTCGAVTGAFLALGLTFDASDPDAKEKIHALTREFAERFKQHEPSIICRELLGCEIYTPAGKEHVKEHDLRAKVCERLVRRAAMLTEEFLRANQKI